MACPLESVVRRSAAQGVLRDICGEEGRQGFSPDPEPLRGSGPDGVRLTSSWWALPRALQPVLRRVSWYRPWAFSCSVRRVSLPVGTMVALGLSALPVSPGRDPFAAGGCLRDGYFSRAVNRARRFFGGVRRVARNRRDVQFLPLSGGRPDRGRPTLGGRLLERWSGFGLWCHDPPADGVVAVVAMRPPAGRVGRARAGRPGGVGLAMMGLKSILLPGNTTRRLRPIMVNAS